MKTKQISFSKMSISSSLFLAALIMIACGGKNSAATSDSTNTATTASVKAPDIDLHTAVLTDNIDAVKQHIAAGSNLNEKDPFGGSSPLITASLFGKVEAAKVLIDAGADVNFQNNDGSTALHTGAFFCRPEIVKMLLENGADK